ncbi:MAG: alpha/beta hydrolase [Gammaproteobacteria bacterium]|nr:alpha/beta hydrolase [Gammaproteobacteria bacterium]
MKHSVQLLSIVFGIIFSTATVQARGLDLPEEFDGLGPTVHSYEAPSGRTLAYIDHGDSYGHVLVFLGGWGTSVRVFNLLEFARTMRETLGIRVISVERNGLGQTAFDPSLGFADYTQDVEELLTHLGVNQFSIMAISGGGPYAARIIAAHPDRILSVHMAAAITDFGTSSDCTYPGNPEVFRFYSNNPTAWWGWGPDTPTINQVEGLKETADDDATRLFYMGGQQGDPAALAHETGLYGCAGAPENVPDLSTVTVPVFIYIGEEDGAITSVPKWLDMFSGVEPTVRLYPGEGHTVQYRHFDQIMIDIVGYKNQLVVCEEKGHGHKAKLKTRLMKEKDALKKLEKGKVTLGMCAWR